MENIISNDAISRRNYWIAEIGKLSGNFVNDFERLEKEIDTEIEKYGVNALIDHVRLCGSIPEIFGHDSSEEKLYSKYTDLILAKVFVQLGLESTVLKERADAADVEVEAEEYNFVADAKAFRLSRTAKNAKDFKVSSMHLWKKGKKYAMVVCPIYQLPKSNSQIYLVATTSDVCIFTYSHLALLLCYSIREGQTKAQELLKAIFECIKSENPTKSAISYWENINKIMLEFSESIKELWECERKASLEAIDIAKKEDLTLLEKKKTQIMNFTLEQAREELIKVYNIPNKTAAINSVKDNGLFEIKIRTKDEQLFK